MRRFRGFDRQTRATIVAKLKERDGPTCGLCLTALDPAIGEPNHPAATTIDHLVPLSDGGDVGNENRVENLRLVHSRCNGRRVKNDGLRPERFARELRELVARLGRADREALLGTTEA